MSILGAQKMFSSNAKTQAYTLKQLAFLDAENLKGLCPKMFNVARKRLFTSLSYLYIYNDIHLPDIKQEMERPLNEPS